MEWNGISKQKDFGREAEMIIQRGANFTITKIEKKGWQIFMDVEVHPEKGYELIQQDPAEWKGRKDKFR
jgi:phenylacetate-coenzyme A ligase PaaK-like adenylate-forming protein